MNRLPIFILIALFSFSLSGQSIQKGPSGKPLALDYKQIGISPLKDLNSPVPVQKSIINEHPDFSINRLGQLGKPLNVGDIKVLSTDKLGQPTWIEGQTPEARSRINMAVDDQAYAYLNDISHLLGIRDVQSEFKIVTRKNDDIGWKHFKLQQYYMDIPIHGMEVILHANQEGFEAMNGYSFPTPFDFNVIPNLNPDKAEELAQKALASEGLWKKIDRKHFDHFHLERLSAQLMIFIQSDDSPKLVYIIEAFPDLISRYQVIIDAQSGNVISMTLNSCKLHNHSLVEEPLGNGTIPDLPLVEKKSNFDMIGDGPATTMDIDLNNKNRLIHSYEVGGDFILVDASRDMYDNTNSNPPNDFIGVVLTLDALGTSPNLSNFTYEIASSTNNDWTKTEVSAHYNGGKAYEYFRSTFGRNSINGNGGDVISLINVVDEYGDEMDNAFWNGAAMFYGNGNTAFKPLAGAEDVAGHEISHGVVQNTANLTYQGESGALNESFADIFGAMIDRDDWRMGEDVVTNVFPSGALRDLSNPHNGGNSLGDPGWQPAHTDEQYTGNQDNGGVHINSGIPNYAFFKFASNPNVGKDKAEQVFYRALDHYLTKSSQFVDLRLAVENAANDLYSQSVVDAAKSAFDAVGIGAGSGGNYQEDVQTNPGDDYILMTDIDHNALYIAKPDGNILFNPLANFSPISKPSITDDGSVIVFVDADNNLYYIVMDWEAGEIVDDGYLQETPQAIWRNIIVSPEGNTMALLTDESVPELIVISFDLDDIKTFELYNPTFTEGVSTGDVLYADAMEFDKSGQYIMYDAYNELKGVGSQVINYWDVSFINVWNNNNENWGTEIVEKLFSSLPENVSIGNATFSKNSPYIIAFDYIDESNGFNNYYLRAANIETGEVGDIFNNVKLSWPNYSVEDDRLVFDAESNTGTDLLGMVDLNSDKITPNGDAYGFINQAKWGVWFADGERDLSTSLKQPIHETNAIRAFPNPAQDRISIRYISTINQAVHIELIDVMGRSVLKNDIHAHEGENVVDLSLDAVGEGNYLIRITSKEDFKVGLLQIIK